MRRTKIELRKIGEDQRRGQRGWIPDDPLAEARQWLNSGVRCSACDGQRTDESRPSTERDRRAVEDPARQGTRLLFSQELEERNTDVSGRRDRPSSGRFWSGLEPPSARNSVRHTIVQLQRPSPQPTLTWNRPELLLSGHFSDTAPHLCPFFASLRCTRPRVSLPAPAAPRSSAASRRRAAGSDDLPPAGASSIWRASPAGFRFSPAAAGDSSATSA